MSIRLEEYKDRVNFKGRSKREYVKTKVTESIMSLIEDSQYGFTIDVYDKTNKTYSSHDVAILSTKTTQEYEAANIIAPLEVGLDKGTIFKWDGYDWIVLKKMFRPDQPGFNGIAYRCTGELKWIDDDGILHVQPAYIRSGRITNALGVTPDVNRVFDNIVMHDTDWNMMAATQQPNPLPLLHPEMRFVIKGQSYRVTNVDNVSIDNVSILSLVDLFNLLPNHLNGENLIGNTSKVIPNTARKSIIIRIALNNSSNIITLGFSISTCAIPNFCFIPSEYSLYFLSFS